MQLLSHVIGIGRRVFPSTFFKDRRKKVHFQHLVDKMQAKFSSWKKLLSTGDRMILMKHVLLAISKYIFAIMEPTKCLLYKMENIISSLFQSDLDEKDHRRWRRWSSPCYLMEENGRNAFGTKCHQKVIYYIISN